MIPRFPFHFCMLVRAVAVTLAVPVYAVDGAHQAPRDNSGRQIAVVVPGMPHPAPVSQAVSATPIVLPRPASGHAELHMSHGPHKAHRLSVVATPTEVSPEVKAAVARGVVIAQGLSRVAVKRFSDFSAWIATLWRQINDIPRVTPNEPIAAEPTNMQEITEPDGRRSQMFYTSEHRMRTVVSR